MKARSVEHVHEWEFFGWRGGILTEPFHKVKPFDTLTMLYSCKCGARCEDRPTEEQRKDYLENHSLFNTPPENDVHVAWHAFVKKFIRPESKKNPARWKWTGYALMTRIEKWYKTTPYKSFIQLLGCDDHCHSSSMMVLVDHRSVKQYMGVTLVYIPQNAGGVGYMNEPSISFLYPIDRNHLILALTRVAECQKELEPIEEKFQEEQRELHGSWKPSAAAVEELK